MYNQIEHGANTRVMKEKFNIKEEILDFSSNVGSEKSFDIEKILKYENLKLDEYPDIDYKELREAIADYEEIASDMVIPGNGATEIIYLISRSIKCRWALINPTFSEYERALKISGNTIFEFFYSEDFFIPIENIIKNLENFDAMMICNPNNPTGNIQNLEKIVKVFKENKKLLVVDETFLDFLSENKKYSLKSLLKDNENLIIIKAFTKTHAAAGIRLGYALLNNFKLKKCLWQNKEPWTINNISMKIGINISKQKIFLKNMQENFKKDKDDFIKKLKLIPKVEVFKSDTNFCLIKTSLNSLEFRDKFFQKEKILVRSCSNFKGLSNNMIRIAIKNKEKNSKFLEALKKFSEEEL